MYKLTLYDFAPVPSPQKVRMALAEKGIEYERITVDLRTGAQRSPDYLALNPHGYVPTLLINGVPIYESTAIIEFLEEVFPEPPLLPREPLERARARMIEEVIDANFAAGLKTYNRLRRVKEPSEAERQALETAVESVNWHVRWLDRELEARSYFAGELFSVADIAAICNLEFQVARLKLPIGAENRNLLEWYSRIAQRDSFAVLRERLPSA